MADPTITTIKLVPDGAVCIEGDLYIMGRIQGTDEICHVEMHIGNSQDGRTVARLLGAFIDLAEAAAKQTRAAANELLSRI